MLVSQNFPFAPATILHFSVFIWFKLQQYSLWLHKQHTSHKQPNNCNKSSNFWRSPNNMYTEQRLNS